MSTRTDLELDVDDVFQKREWELQRVGWIVWAAIVAAAVAGVLGPGPLSNATHVSKDRSFSVTYDRFVHYHNPTQIEIQLGEAADELELRVKLCRNLLDRLQIKSIDPEPIRHDIASDGVIYTFARVAPPIGGKILFNVDFEEYGRNDGKVEIVGHEPVEFQQFVYP